MKKYLVLLIAFLFVFANCSKSDDDEVADPPATVLVGQDGNPRFNLTFTNPENVDLDLYVKTPSGAVIYYGNMQADEGQLDVDCLCSDCPDGPNENIFWNDGTAPKGTYEYWVEYYDYCTTAGSESNYTVRVIRNGEVLVTKQGTLTSGSSAKWTFEQE
jgi:uncharacterized protein YfaP (DUF2135 family)